MRTVAGPDGTPLRVLRMGGADQSATFLDERRYEAAFAYYRAFDLMFEGGEEVRDVLMLGAGGCSYPKYLVTHREGVRVDAVESDPAIARIARLRFFVDPLLRESADALPRGLDSKDASCRDSHASVLDVGVAGAPVLSPTAGGADAAWGSDARQRAAGSEVCQSPLRVRLDSAYGGAVWNPGTPLLAPGSSLCLVVDDGRSFLERCVAEGRRYDAIANDAFAGARPAASLASLEAIRLVKRALAAGGMYLVNAVSRDGGADVSDAWNLVSVLRGEFSQVSVILCSEEAYAAEDNYLVAATDRPKPLPISSWVVC